MIALLTALPMLLGGGRLLPVFPPSRPLASWLEGAYVMGGLVGGDGAPASFVLRKDGTFSYSRGGCDLTPTGLPDNGDYVGRYRVVDGMVQFEPTKSASNFDPEGKFLPGPMVAIRWNRQVYLVEDRHMLSFAASTRTAWDGNVYADAAGLFNFCKTEPIDAPSDGLRYPRNWEWCSSKCPSPKPYKCPAGNSS